MEQLSDLNKRMRSVSDIRQMTKALQLISAVKMRKAKDTLEKSYPFFAFCAETFSLLRYYAERDPLHYLHARKKKEGDVWKQAYFLFSGEQGMAGSYIMNLIQETEQAIKENLAVQKKKYKAEAKIYLLGNVGKERLENDGFEVEKNFGFAIAPPSYNRSMDLADFIFEIYETEEVDEVFLVYTQMQSAISMKTQSIRVLPAEVHTLKNVYSESKLFNIFKQKSEQDKTKVEFLPDYTEVYEYLIRTYLNGVVYGALTEAFASEQTARMTAMDSATNNADEMIRLLKMKVNQARQTKITNELSEIVSGATALEEKENLIENLEGEDKEESTNA